MKPARKNPKAQMGTPEAIYAELIAAGIVKVVRRKGKPPLIVWTS